jgi:hypothetical protein
MPERNAAKPLEWLISARAAHFETLEYVSRDDEQAIQLLVFVSGVFWCIVTPCRSPKNWFVKT